jgi:hypothetical protein
MGHGLDREERIEGLSVGVSIAPVALRFCVPLRLVRGNDVPRPSVNNHPRPHWQVRTIHVSSVSFNRRRGRIEAVCGEMSNWTFTAPAVRTIRTAKVRGFGVRFTLRCNVPTPLLMVEPRIIPFRTLPPS